MRSAAIAAICMGLLATLSPAVINVKLTADKTALAAGETTTIRIYAQGTAAGLYSLGGNITASGDAVLAANTGSFQWAPAFSPSSFVSPKAGTAGTNGGWSGFGSQQTDIFNPSNTYAKADYIEVAHYTVTAQQVSGTAALTFAGATVGGFKPAETDKTTVMGTLTPVSISVTASGGNGGNGGGGDGGTTPLSGDVDSDGLVGILDVLRLVNAFGCSQGQSGYDAACDFDSSNTVDMADLAVLAGNFGRMN